MNALSQFIDLMFRGGIFMIPLAAVAIAAVVLIVERFLYLRENRVDHERLHYELRAALKDEGLDKAVVLAARTKGMVGRVLEEGLRKVQAGERDIELATEQSILNEMEQSKKSRGWLATLIQIAPLLGIVGTVYGMIIAFMQIEHSASTDPKLLAGGIYQALVTTFFGLIIAIGGSMAQEHIRKRINRMLYGLDLMIVEVRDWLGGRQGALATTSDAPPAEPWQPGGETPANRDEADHD